MLKIALIGLGKMGISHLAVVRSHPLVSSVIVCDSATYLLDVLSKYTGVKTYSNYETMFGAELLDAVIIATPSRYHGEITRAALTRGIHVFCEKPFCLDFDEAEELADLAEKKKLVNQVGYHYRFVASFREARRLLSAGTLGRVHHIRAEAYGPVVLQPKGSTWRARKGEGGGCLYDYASHAIDLMNYLVGPPIRVSGSVVNKVFSNDVDDEVYATFDYGAGFKGQLATNWSEESFRKMSMKVSVWGTEGRITADRQEVQIYYRGRKADHLRLQNNWSVRYTTELTEGVWFYLRGEEYSSQIDHFIKLVTSQTNDNVSSFATALQADKVIDLIQRDAAGENARTVAFSKPAKVTLLNRLLRGA